MSVRFLVATDGSSHGDRALEHALTIAAAADADLTVVTAVEPSVSADPNTEEITDLADAEETLIQESTEDAERRAERVLDEARETADEEGVDVTTRMLYGNPVEVVAEFAADEGFDGVYVGHRGLDEEAERVLGSVAKGLVQRSTVPVTVVR